MFFFLTTFETSVPINSYLSPVIIPSASSSNSFSHFIIIGENVATFLENVGTESWLQGLINDGIIGGVGAVLGFVPQIMLLFFYQ